MVWILLTATALSAEPLHLEPALEASIGAASGAMLLAAHQTALRPQPGRAGDPQMIWAGETPSKQAARASDVLLYGSVGLAATLPLLTAPAARRRGLTETVVLGEALTLNLSANLLVKQTWAESRPFIENDLSEHSPAELSDVLNELRRGDAYRSFYSGHTSMVATASAGLGTLAMLRTEAAPWQAAAVGLGAGLTLGYVQGGLRNAAWKHDRNDVWVALAVGSGIGVLVPWLHTLQTGRGVSVWVGPRGGGLHARF